MRTILTLLCYIRTFGLNYCRESCGSFNAAVSGGPWCGLHLGPSGTRMVVTLVMVVSSVIVTRLLAGTGGYQEMHPLRHHLPWLDEHPAGTFSL